MVVVVQGMMMMMMMMVKVIVLEQWLLVSHVVRCGSVRRPHTSISDLDHG